MNKKRKTQFDFRLIEAEARIDAQQAALDAGFEERESLRRQLLSERARNSDLTERLAQTASEGEVKDLVANVRAARVSLSALHHLSLGRSAMAIVDAIDEALREAVEIGEGGTISVSFKVNDVDVSDFFDEEPTVVIDAEVAE